MIISIYFIVPINEIDFIRVITLAVVYIPLLRYVKLIGFTNFEFLFFFFRVNAESEYFKR